MPELPEVEYAATRLRAAVTGRTIGSLRLLHRSLRKRLTPRVLRSLRSVRIAGVERRGKHQLVRLDDERTLHVHFRMTGDWVVDRAGDPLPRFARAVLELDDGTRVVLEDSRALSTIDVHAPGSSPALALGPEPADESFSPEWLGERFARRRAAVKVVLLDQAVVAGLGNIYAAEALWRARLDPRMTADRISGAQLRALHRAIRTVIARASGSRYQESSASRFDVYDREGRACRRCGEPIERIVQAGRSTYFCPACQSSRPPSRTSVNRVPRATRP